MRPFAMSFLAALLPLAAFGAVQEAHYDTALLPDVMVPMRDGIKLATNIYRPASKGTPATGRFPVILNRPEGTSCVGSSIG